LSNKMQMVAIFVCVQMSRLAGFETALRPWRESLPRVTSCPHTQVLLTSLSREQLLQCCSAPEAVSLQLTHSPFCSISHLCCLRQKGAQLAASIALLLSLPSSNWWQATLAQQLAQRLDCCC
jgi:hypothetical protein